MIIYKITNQINNKVYIGQTTLTIEKRFKTHLKDAYRTDRPTRYFHRALKKYGKENFTIEQIDIAFNKKELSQKEIYWIHFYQANNRHFGYNLSTGGESGLKNLSTKQKIGKRKKENWQDPILAKKMRAGLNLATQAWQQKCLKEKITLQCKYCKKDFQVIPSKKNRKYCSMTCSGKDVNPNGLIEANKKNKQNYEVNKKRIQEITFNWVNKNKKLIQDISIKSHSISKELNPLKEAIQLEFDFKDWRTISKYICGDHRITRLLSFLKSL